MPFRYKLQKLYGMRERKKKEQEQVVQEAEAAVRKVQAKLNAKLQEQADVRQQRQQIDAMMLERIDLYLQHLVVKIQEIQVEVDQAKQKLKDEEALLAQYHMELEALEKHKEKAKETWLEEEKAREMKVLDEIASQRYFRQMVERAAEEAEDERN
jgi:flagellar protein FliJ